MRRRPSSAVTVEAIWSAVCRCCLSALTRLRTAVMNARCLLDHRRIAPSGPWDGTTWRGSSAISRSRLASQALALGGRRREPRRPDADRRIHGHVAREHDAVALDVEADIAPRGGPVPIP